MVKKIHSILVKCLTTFAIFHVSVIFPATPHKMADISWACPSYFSDCIDVSKQDLESKLFLLSSPCSRLAHDRIFFFKNSQKDIEPGQLAHCATEWVNPVL
jgi:hypothetical protein